MTSARKDTAFEAKKSTFPGRNTADQANESLGAAMCMGYDKDKLKNTIKKSLK